MFKKIYFLVALGLVAASCNVKEERGLCSAPVSVHVNDFRVTIDHFSDTKATQNVADYTDLKVLTLAFYNGNEEVFRQSQTNGALAESETFGRFSLALPLGTYTMVVIGHGLKDGESAVTLTGLHSATFGENPARETFVATETVTINSTAAVNISATLDRIVSKLQVASSDVRKNPAHSVRMTFAAGGKSFNPTTGLATDNSGFSNTVNISTAVGAASLSNSYLFLASDEDTIDVTIETLDEDGNMLFSKTVANVPFKRNRITKLTGAMYTNDAISGSFQLETAWLQDQEVSF